MKKVILIDEVIARVEALMSEAQKADEMMAYNYLCELMKWLRVRNY